MLCEIDAPSRSAPKEFLIKVPLDHHDELEDTSAQKREPESFSVWSEGTRPIERLPGMSTLIGSPPKKTPKDPAFRREVFAGVASGVISGIVVGVALFTGQLVVDNNRADREHARADTQLASQNKIEADRSEQAILLENLRFVRGLSSAETTGVSRPFRGLDLHGLELGGLSLAGADFANANLKGTSFRDATLRGARFGGADVNGADFTGANMSGSTFYYGTDENKPSGKGPTSLAQADLTGVRFFRISTWSELNLSGSLLCGATFDEINFSDAFIAGAQVDRAFPQNPGLPKALDTSVKICDE